MNRRLVFLVVILAAAAGVVGYLQLSGGDSAPAGPSGANAGVKVVSGSGQAVVQGTVTRAGKPASGITVEIYAGRNASGELIGSSVTGATGMYVFGALEDGPHFVRAEGARGVVVIVDGNGAKTRDITLP